MNTETMTIDELAQAAGVTKRLDRALQSFEDLRQHLDANVGWDADGNYDPAKGAAAEELSDLLGRALRNFGL